MTTTATTSVYDIEVADTRRSQGVSGHRDTVADTQPSRGADMTNQEWPHLSDVPRDRAAVVDQVRAAAIAKKGRSMTMRAKQLKARSVCTTLHRFPGTRFTISATAPDGTQIDERYVGVRGTIIAHVATITVPSSAEEIYAVAYDDPTRAPELPSVEWWATSDIPLLSDRWMCTALLGRPDDSGPTTYDIPAQGDS